MARSDINWMLLTCTILGALWFISWHAGFSLRKTPAGPAYRKLSVTAHVTYSSCLALNIAGHLADLPPLLAAAGAAVIVMMAAARDPLRRGFWHHRRLRSFGSCALICIFTLSVPWLAHPGALTLASGLWVFFMQQRSSSSLAQTAWADSLALQKHNLSLTAALTQAASLPNSRLRPPHLPRFEELAAPSLHLVRMPGDDARSSPRRHRS